LKRPLEDNFAPWQWPPLTPYLSPQNGERGERRTAQAGDPMTLTPSSPEPGERGMVRWLPRIGPPKGESLARSVVPATPHHFQPIEVFFDLSQRHPQGEADLDGFGTFQKRIRLFQD
jgi:hypothetical protein